MLDCYDNGLAAVDHHVTPMSLHPFPSIHIPVPRLCALSWVRANLLLWLKLLPFEGLNFWEAKEIS